MLANAKGQRRETAADGVSISLRVKRLAPVCWTNLLAVPDSLVQRGLLSDLCLEGSIEPSAQIVVPMKLFARNANQCVDLRNETPVAVAGVNCVCQIKPSKYGIRQFVTISPLGPVIAIGNYFVMHMIVPEPKQNL